MKEVKKGSTKSATFVVKEKDLAINLGSGSLEVLGTPALAYFMESLCKDFLSNFLQEDESTVGTYIEIKHLKPSFIGETIKIEASLVSQKENRFFDFEIKAFASQGEPCAGGQNASGSNQAPPKLIAEAKHQRAQILESKFMQKRS